MKASEKVSTALFILRYRHLVCKVTGTAIYSPDYIKWANDVLSLFFALARAYRGKLKDWQLCISAVWQTLRDPFHASHSIARTLADYLRKAGEVVRGMVGLQVKPVVFQFVPGVYNPSLFAQSETIETRCVQRVKVKGRRAVKCSKIADYLQGRSKYQLN